MCVLVTFRYTVCAAAMSAQCDVVLMCVLVTFRYIVCAALNRIATIVGESDILADIMEDMIKSFEDVCIDTLYFVHTLQLSVLMLIF